MDTSYELVKLLLKSSSSKNPVADFDLAAKYDGAIALDIVLEKLYETRQVQRANVLKDGQRYDIYWLTGMVIKSTYVDRVQRNPPTPVPPLQLAKDNVNGINLVPASTVSKTETVAPAPQQDGEKRSKVSRILEYMEQVGGWCNAASLAKFFGCSCAADFLKTHIARGDVLLNNLGRGKKMIRIKPGMTAADCIENSHLAKFKGLRLMDKKPARNTTKKIQALMAMEEPPKLDEWEGQDNAIITTDANQPLQPQQEKAAESEITQPDTGQCAANAVGGRTGEIQHVPQLQTEKRPAFRIAYTNDGCLILKNVLSSMRLLPADIELDVAQTRDLVNFISALDLEAQP